MDVPYYIPSIYVEDVEQFSAVGLLEARAKCIELFRLLHPEASIVTAPAFDIEKTE